MKIINKISVFLFLSMVSNSVLAQEGAKTNLVRMVDNMTSLLTLDVPELMKGIAFLVGLGLAVMGILKLKAANESKGQVSYAVPIMMLLGAIFMLWITVTINIGVESLTGGKGVDEKGNTQFKY